MTEEPFDDPLYLLSCWLELALRAKTMRVLAAHAELVFALRELVDIINAAGLINLSNGVQLGQTSWFVKASDRLKWAEWVLDHAGPSVGEVK